MEEILGGAVRGAGQARKDIRGGYIRGDKKSRSHPVMFLCGDYGMLK